MAKFVVRPSMHGPRTSYSMTCEETGQRGNLTASQPSGYWLRLGNLEPIPFETISEWKLWMRRQGHELEMKP